MKDSYHSFTLIAYHFKITNIIFVFKIEEKRKHLYIKDILFSSSM